MHDAATAPTPAVLFLRVPPVPKDDTRRYEEWYDEVHIPYRLRLPGFIGAERWTCAGDGPRYLVFYELADMEALWDREYLALRRWEATQPPETFEGAGTTGRPGFERGVYEVRGGTPALAGMSRPGGILLLGYDPETSHADDFRQWVRQSYIDELGSLPGATAVRHLELTERTMNPQSGLRTPRPRTLLAVYLADPSVCDGPVFEAHRLARWRARGVEASSVHVGKLAMRAGDMVLP
ncbi:hypothetical protein ACSBPH_04600 [Microbacterium sp. F51-2R]|uniref:hypothetical protein n=1 Tax=Microbacterium sp. F51-2R TaxID=3445777 RepID=UPI003FA0612C